MTKIAVLFLILGISLVGAYWYSSKEFIPPTQIQDGILSAQSLSEEQVIEVFFSPLISLDILGTSYRASVARTNEERVKGLSDTPFMPRDIIKLFVFDTEDFWGIWMKDMNYPLDIVWLDGGGVVVHIESAVSPDTYPTVFRPDTPSLFVIEAVPGFVEENAIEIGAFIDLQSIL